MNCPRCDATVSADANFCNRCGQSLTAYKGASATNTPYSPTNAPTSSYQQGYQGYAPQGVGIRVSALRMPTNRVRILVIAAIVVVVVAGGIGTYAYYQSHFIPDGARSAINNYLTSDAGIQNVPSWSVASAQHGDPNAQSALDTPTQTVPEEVLCVVITPQIFAGGNINSDGSNGNQFYYSHFILYRNGNVWIAEGYESDSYGYYTQKTATQFASWGCSNS